MAVARELDLEADDVSSVDADVGGEALQAGAVGSGRHGLQRAVDDLERRITLDGLDIVRPDRLGDVEPDEVEHLGGADVQAFETEGLIGTGAAPAVLGYLFHRIEGRLDGRPTLLIVDEGWLALDDPSFGAQLREWLKTLRKKNASVVFATQSLADVADSAIAPALIARLPHSAPTGCGRPMAGASAGSRWDCWPCWHPPPRCHSCPHAAPPHPHPRPGIRFLVTSRLNAGAVGLSALCQ